MRWLDSLERTSNARGILISIITTAIYILVSLVAVGNLVPEEISRYKEYALAVAPRLFLGKAGFILVGLGALLSTASAINATLFSTTRLGIVMAQESELPKAFSHKQGIKDISYVSLIFISALTLLFVNTTDLTVISSFASFTFLGIFLVSLGAAAGLLATYRFLQTEKQIMEDTYQRSIVADILVAVLLGSIGILLVNYLINNTII